jgi:pyruvate, orthophosphate dikinase
MVFGNFDASSGSGVAFTRNPNTGERELYGEFLLGCQGEDLVSGSSTPISITESGALSAQHSQELYEHGQRLEGMYGDAVDIEFTVEGAQLYFLQVRPAKRTAQAAVRIAADLVDDNILSTEKALQKVSVEQLKKLLRPAFEPAALASARALTQGIGASPGHSYGIAVLDADRAATMAAAGERVVLLRPTTSPQDIRGMLASQAIVTARGGALSHAAVVSRALDVPCVVGCEAMDIQPDQRRFTVDGQTFEEGAPLSVDGATGYVYSGILPLESTAHAAGHIDRILGWSDDMSKVQFWVAGVSGSDARVALRQSPAGLGVIALTDLMIAAGTLDELLDAINDLSQQPDRKDTQDRLTRISFGACRKLLLESNGAPIDLRMPNLGSPRAQRMIGAWASLAPRLFLPLGVKSLYMPLLRGIADAAQETGHRKITPLAAGIIAVEELQAFRRDAASLGIPDAGAVLQSPAGLTQASSIAGASTALWVDIREVIRTFYGFPSALSFGDEVFEGYVADGYLRLNPRTGLGPHLRDALGALVTVAKLNPGLRLGVDCGEATAQSLIEDLYQVGLRSFSVSAPATAGMRLALGQLAVRNHSHG